jgi:hypothetical protein
LCPVEGSYCFTSPLWEKCDFKVHRLEANMRQQGDPLFKEVRGRSRFAREPFSRLPTQVLDRVRFGQCSLIDLKILEQLKDTTFPEGIKPTRLYSKNVSVDAINMRELRELGASETREYVTEIKGDYAKRWATTNRIPEKVTVCVGAQVRASGCSPRSSPLTK